MAIGTYKFLHLVEKIIEDNLGRVEAAAGNLEMVSQTFFIEAIAILVSGIDSGNVTSRPRKALRDLH